MQTPLGITPDLRLNFDYVFLLKEDSQINKKKLYENYASMFPNLTVFDKVFTECTKDHCSMVVDNRKPTDTIEEKVFWFKAKERKFSFGSSKFIDIHHKYYNKNYVIDNIKAHGADNSRLFGKRKNDIDLKIEKV